MFNRAALQELFDYGDYTWAVFGNVVRGLPDGGFTKPVPGSGWPALRDAMFHIGGAWDGWIIEQAGRLEAERGSINGPSLQVQEAEAFQSWEALSGYRGPLRGMLGGLLRDLSDQALLEEQIEIWDGRAHQTRAEVIGHILIHELRHHGDITTLLDALGASLPMSDYGIYRFFKNRAPSDAG